MKHIVKHIVLILTLTFSVFCQAGQVSAPVSATTRQEIAHLFSYLENSACQLNRNGSWYEARQASAHLNQKYQYLLDKNLLTSSESFIEKAATESSISGKAYLVKCKDSAPLESAPWFKAELARYRQAGR